MSKLSPLQQVRADHGSKEKLAEKVAKILERPEDEDAEDFEHRVHTMSNRKLLRLWESNEQLIAAHGSRDALVDKIVKARFAGGNDDYASKIGAFSVPRLIDLARQSGI